MRTAVALFWCSCIVAAPPLLAMPAHAAETRSPAASGNGRSMSVAASPPGDEQALACYQHHEAAQLTFRQQHWLEARGTFLQCARKWCPAAVRAECVEWVEKIDRSLPSVVVTASAGGEDIVDVKVIVDEKVIAQRLTGAAIRLDPGQHRLRFESSHGRAVERTVLVSEGIKERPIQITFEPPAPDTLTAAAKPPRPRARLGAFDYTMGAVALASWGTFVVAGSWALYQRHELQQDCAPVCSEARVHPIATKLFVADVALLAAVMSSSIFYLRLTRTPAGTLDAGSAHGITPFAQATSRGAACGIVGLF